MRISTAFTLLCFLVFHVSSSTFAQTLCADFGVGGIARSLESHRTHFNALTVLSSGKIVAVGYYDNNTDTDFLVARYNADGTLDNTFGERGIQIYDLTGNHDNDKALSVAVATDGRILVGGVSDSYGSIIKLNSNGSLYTSFGTAGKIKYDILYTTVEELLVTPEGNIYAVGKSFNSLNIVFLQLKVHAYAANGTPIDSFGENGKYNDLNFVVWHETAIKAALQSDGKIVIAGTQPGGNATFDKWVMLRLTLAGIPDVSFGNDGIVEDPEFGTAAVQDIKIDAEGTIYLVGFSSQDAENTSFAVAKKFQSSGESDNSFNMTGSAQYLGTGSGAIAYAAATDNTGGVYIAGVKFEDNDNTTFLLTAFNSDGHHDQQFGTHTSMPSGFVNGTLRDMVRLTNGSFIACGYATGADREYGFLVKYKATGALDANFGNAGYDVLRYADDASISTIEVQADGKILAGGVYLNNGSNTGLALARFQTNGLPDLTFGTYGYVRYDVGERREFMSAIHIYSDGKILVGGTYNNETSGDDYLLIKFNANGTVDNSFGNGGYITKHIGAYGKHNGLNQIKVDGQGRILIAGDANYLGGSYGDATLMRLLPDGTTDTGFGDNGIARVTLTVVHDSFQDLVIAPNGSMYAIGAGTVNVGAAVVKFDASGTIDENFGSEGIVHINWSDQHITQGIKAVLRPDGSLVVGSTYRLPEEIFNRKLFLYALLPSGAPDLSFGEAGIVELGVSKGHLHGLLQDDDGTLYVSGELVSGETQFFLAKVDSDGTKHEPYFIKKEFRSDANIAMNHATGAIYAGLASNFSSGLSIGCIGNGGGNEQPVDEACDGVPQPTITHIAEVLYASDGDTFQWYSSGNALMGETNQSLVINPVNGGVYSVSVLSGECLQFSDDYDYLVTGVESESQNPVQVYPNPVLETIFISSDKDLSNSRISLYSMQGTVVLQKTDNTGFTASMAAAHLPAGIYFLTIQSGNGKEVIRIAKTH